MTALLLDSRRTKTGAPITFTPVFDGMTSEKWFKADEMRLD